MTSSFQSLCTNCCHEPYFTYYSHKMVKRPYWSTSLFALACQLLACRNADVARESFFCFLFQHQSIKRMDQLIKNSDIALFSSFESKCSHEFAKISLHFWSMKDSEQQKQPLIDSSSCRLPSFLHGQFLLSLSRFWFAFNKATFHQFVSSLLFKDEKLD